jgi:hypothetical protein
MLTKGDQKIRRSDEHFNRVRKKMNSMMSSDTVINSDDATTWAQRFVMPVFGCFLSRIFPASLMEPVMFALNLVTDKKLDLPTKLLELYSDKPDIKSTDPAMNELKSQFLGLSDQNDLLVPGTRFLKNRSNMMHGILHYTSSLLHAGYLIMYEDYCKKFIDNRMRAEGCDNYHYFTTSKVSSDDSSLIQSIVYETRSDNKSSKHYLSVLSELKSKFYNQFCAEQSSYKSTVSCLSGVEEFNSVWYYKNTVLSPIIKFIASSIKSHMNSRMSDRFNSFANLRKDIFENGGNIGLCQAIYC